MGSSDGALETGAVDTMVLIPTLVDTPRDAELVPVYGIV